jgi:hypothetical protein
VSWFECIEIVRDMFHVIELLPFTQGSLHIQSSRQSFKNCYHVGSSRRLVRDSIEILTDSCLIAIVLRQGQSDMTGRNTG